MNLCYKVRTGIVVLLLSGLGTSCSKSNDSVSEKVKNKSEEVSDEVAEAYKDSKEEVCKMVNGKIECAKKRIESEMEN